MIIEHFARGVEDEQRRRTEHFAKETGIHPNEAFAILSSHHPQRELIHQMKDRVLSEERMNEYNKRDLSSASSSDMDYLESTDGAVDPSSS